jgi:hypothetical protein
MLPAMLCSLRRREVRIAHLSRSESEPTKQHLARLLTYCFSITFFNFWRRERDSNPRYGFP